MPRRPALLRLITALFPLILASCGPSLDAEQSRLCRMLLPALFSIEDGLVVLESEGVSERAAHITFRAGAEGSRLRLLSCRFGGTGYSAAKRDLVAVTLDGIGLGEAQMWFLKERWLESQIAIQTDPGPPIGERGWLETSRGTANALQHAIGALPRLTILTLLALATALIYGIIGRINLAFGEFAAMGGMVMTITVSLLAAMFAGAPGMIESLALLAVLVTTALWGHVTGKHVLSPLAIRGGQPILVAGVGLLMAVQEGLRLAQGARNALLPPVGSGGLILASAGDFNVIVSPRFVSIAVTGALMIGFVLIYMRRSHFGMAWRAIADDPEAARLIGLNPRSTLIAASLLATALAGLAGAFITLFWGGMSFSGGTMLGLTGLMAAILGGIGSLGGAVIAALAIGVVQAGWMAIFPIEHWELVSFTILTLVLVLKPGGFFGYADGAERRF
ncbi:MAG: branched-chain amino acid ABC transporter permease [Rhabdaerophilum sp.]